MTKTILALAAVCALGAVGLAAVQSQAKPAGLSSDEIIAARQASFAMSAASFNGMAHAVDGGAEAKAMAFSANGLAKWAKVLPSLFPVGTGPSAKGAKTRALPAIWSDRKGFDKAAADYQAATAKLLDLAKANDTAGFKAQIKVVDDACGACHKPYLVPAPAPPPPAAPK